MKWDEVIKESNKFNKKYKEAWNWKTAQDYFNSIGYIKEKENLNVLVIKTIKNWWGQENDVINIREWIEFNFGQIIPLFVNPLIIFARESISNPNNFEQIKLEFISKLEEYIKLINKYLSQVEPIKFNYKGFQIQNFENFSSLIIKKYLEGVDYLIYLFKQRGVEDLLQFNLSSISLKIGKTYENAGFYYPIYKKIELIVLPYNIDFPGIRTEKWIHEVFIHEFGHHIYHTLPNEARKEWNSYWEKLKDQTILTFKDRKIFWSLLKENSFDYTKVGKKLTGVNRIKYLIWLWKAQTLLTPGQLRLNTFGKEMFSFLRNPEIRMPRGNFSNNEQQQKSIQNELEGIKEALYLNTENDIEMPWEQKKLLKKIIEDSGVSSEYGKTSADEDFAETFLLFMINPHQLNETSLYRIQRTLYLSGIYGKTIVKLSRRLLFPKIS